MKMPNLFALTAAVLVTSATLSIVHTNLSYTPTAPVDLGNIVQLAPIRVVPSAAERHAAELLDMASKATGGMDRTWEAKSSRAAGLLGARLAMPYYSFSSAISGISKE